MIGLGISALKVYLAVEPCDMRKGFNGLRANAPSELPNALGAEESGDMGMADMARAPPARR